MKNYFACKPLRLLPAVMASSLLLSACETPPVAPEKPVTLPTPAPAPAPTPAPEAQPPAPSVESLQLKDGITLYNNGNYNEAIKRLNSAEIWGSRDKGVQVEAAKYMAFSYCVTNRQSLCRQQFERLLKLDPGFELSPGEKGHPLWGPVFAKAKRNLK